MTNLAHKVAARFKKKKEVPSEDGGKTTVYEYSDRQVALRNSEKAKRIESLRGRIGDLRTQVHKDLRSSDPDKFLTALAVALMDETYERVGNEDSADEGHFGVTGWQRSHVSFGRGKATISYVGKSGVKQTKTVKTPAFVKALKDAYEAADGDEACLFCHDTGKIDGGKINAYLKKFEVTAKDIRGLHANEEMRKQLKVVRKGALPTDPKERKDQLKSEWDKALEATAKLVGHEPSTLNSQYLVPGLEDKFKGSGTILKRLDKAARIAARFMEAKHSRSKCMSCSEPPTVAYQWADGRALAWFCKTHSDEWKKGEDREIIQTYDIDGGEVPRSLSNLRAAEGQSGSPYRSLHERCY